MDESRISEDAKVMTNEFYHKSLSEDPSISCQNIMHLVTHLQGLMERCENHEYDIVLNIAGKYAGQSWYEYSQNHIGRAVLIKSLVLRKVDALVKDPRFSKYKMPAFTGR